MRGRKLRRKQDEVEQAKKAECSFKPQINDYKPEENAKATSKSAKHVKVSTSKSTSDRCKVLYELSKKIVKKEDKPTDEYLFEKEKKEYTFAPNTKKEEAAAKPEGTPEDPMISETIERLKKAREEHERVKRGTERGVADSGMHFDMEVNKFKKSVMGSKVLGASHISTRSKEDHKDSPAKKEEKQTETSEPQTVLPVTEMKMETETKARTEPAEIPTIQMQPEQTHAEPQTAVPAETSSPLISPGKEEKLYIDVNLGENVERIVVHKGDTAAALADKFAKEHSMKQGVDIGRPERRSETEAGGAD